MNENIPFGNISDRRAIECPMCRSNRVNVLIETETFEYGTGGDVVELSAQVPLHTCLECSFEFTDELAETRRHEAVCKHLGLLTPHEIVALRNSVGMTRSRFSELTSLGEASLGRWERGVLFQSKAYDKLLRLLRYKENVHRLLTLSEVPNGVVVGDVARSPIFDALQPEILKAKRKDAKLFELRPTSSRYH